LRQNKHRAVTIVLLVLTLIIVGSCGLACVRGLQPIGWSGGAVSGDTLFVGTKEGRLVAVNMVDEGRQWSEPLKVSSQSGGFGCAPTLGGGCGAGAAKVAIYGTPAIAGELVYISAYNGKVYAYNADSLGVRWVYPREGYLEPIVSGVATDGENVYFGGSDGKVYALNAINGDKQWEFETGDKVWSTPTIADGRVYIGSFDNKLYALDAGDGSLIWEFTSEGAIAATPLVDGSTVYIGSFDRHLYAVDAANGSMKWRFMGGNWFWAKPVVDDTTVYAGCLDGKVYALRADNGNKVTEFDLGSPVVSSPVIVNGDMVFASREGVIYKLGTASNKMERLANIEAEVFGPLTADNGVVYIHTPDLTLHRVNAETGALLMSVSLESKD